MSLIPIHQKHLTTDGIKSLYPLVNKPGDWQIRTDSVQLVDKIIELWFDSQGYDFWDNPYPNVTEWRITEKDEIIFKYETNST